MLFPLQMSSCALKPDPSLDCNCPSEGDQVCSLWKELRLTVKHSYTFFFLLLLLLFPSKFGVFPRHEIKRRKDGGREGGRDGKRKGLKKEKTKKRAHSRIWIPGSKASLPFVFREDDLRPRQGGEAGRRRWGPSPWNPVEASEKRRNEQSSKNCSAMLTASSSGLFPL